MSLFDVVTDFFSGGDGIGAIIGAAGAVGSAAIQASANNNAAEIAAQAARDQTAAIRDANAQAQRQFDAIQASTAPGVSHLRSVTIGPTGLTPEQEFELGEARREATRQLGASGLRGSGRATAAVLDRVESGFRNTAITSNQNRQDVAAGRLAGANFSAGTNAANAAIGQGRDTAGIIGTAGDNQANAGIANARLTGQALADVGSIIADSTKKRESRFGDTDDRRRTTNYEEEEVL